MCFSALFAHAQSEANGWLMGSCARPELPSMGQSAWHGLLPPHAMPAVMPGMLYAGKQKRQCNPCSKIGMPGRCLVLISGCWEVQDCLPTL